MINQHLKIYSILTRRLADRYEKIDIDRQWKNFSETDGLAYLYLVESRCCCCRNMFIVGNGLVVLPASPSFSSAGNCSNGSEAVRLVLSLQGESWTFRTVKM